MKPSIALAMLGGLCAVLTACGAPPQSPTPVPMPPKPTAAAPTPRAPAPAVTTPATPAASTVAAVRPGQAGAQLGGPLVPVAPPIPMGDAAKYEDKGRKDPFIEVSLSSSTGGLSVVTTKLTGIVRGRRATLALLETQEGIGYILKPGDTLGDGRLMEIGADNVVFAVAPKAGLTAQRVVLRLAAN